MAQSAERREKKKRILKMNKDSKRGENTFSSLPLLGGGQEGVLLKKTMKKHKHFPNYTSALVGNARLLRRKMTNAERKLWNCLRGKQMKLPFRRQIPFDQYVLDFYCPKANLIIEVDGGQHYTKEGIQRDQRRDSYLQQHGLNVLRFSDRDVLMNISGVRQKIYEEIERYLKIEETPP